MSANGAARNIGVAVNPALKLLHTYIQLFGKRLATDEVRRVLDDFRFCRHHCRYVTKEPARSPPSFAARL